MNEVQTPLVGWFNGQWLSVDHLGLPINDWGLLQGAMVVDRLRTIEGRPLDVEQHLQRFVEGIHSLQIDLPVAAGTESLEEQLSQLVESCFEKNRRQIAGDFSIVLLATPGTTQPDAGDANGRGRGTLMVYPVSIPWKRLASWYRDGQELTIAQQQTVSNACWPISIKTRARLNYYLADLGNAGSDRNAILCDTQGNLTETANANIFLAEDGNIVIPPVDTILEGISLRRTIRLANDLKIQILRETISPQRAMAADALLLCGTTGCLWSASQVGEQPYSNAGQNVSVFQDLRSAWIADLGCDFHQQPARHLS